MEWLNLWTHIEPLLTVAKLDIFGQSLTFGRVCIGGHFFSLCIDTRLKSCACVFFAVSVTTPRMLTERWSSQSIGLSIKIGEPERAKGIHSMLYNSGLPTSSSTKHKHVRKRFLDNWSLLCTKIVEPNVKFATKGWTIFYVLGLGLALH